jgi:YVTN family beta-propeller protein
MIRPFATALAIFLSNARPGMTAVAEPRLLVLAKSESVLAVVDPQTLEVVARVPTGDNPHEVCVSNDGKLAIVSNYGAQTPGSTLSVIDIAAGKEIRRVDLSPLKRPHGLWESGGKVYFTAEMNCAVARYDIASDKIDWLCGTGQAGTHMLAMDESAGRLYATNIGSDSVSVIDLAGGAAAAGPTTIAVKSQPEGLALSPDAKELWVAPRIGGGGIAVIDTSTDSITQTVPCKGMPIRVHFTPDGKRVLVTDAANHELAIYDAAARREEKRIHLGEVPIGIVVAPDSRRAFVSASGANKVYVIDLAKLEVTGEFDAGQTPDGMIWAEAKPAPPAMKKPGVFGVAVAPLTDEDRKKLPQNGSAGLLIKQVGPHSPAAEAGLAEGDIILSINGTPVNDPQQFVKFIRRARGGDVMNVAIVHDGQKTEKQVTLKPPPG